MKRWLLQGLLPTSLAALLLVAVLFLGHWAREALRGDEAHQFAFMSIDCTPPAERSRAEFLTEVQYLSGIADRLDLLDPELAKRLERAFTRDPWVERVRRIEVGPHSVKADLVCRIAVLAVPVDGVKELRLVDRTGIQLTSGTVLPGLPRLVGKVAKPAGSPGTKWGEPVVEEAALVAAEIYPYLERLCSNDSASVELDFENNIWKIRGKSCGVIIWGHAPGQEVADEATATEKVRRLVEALAARVESNTPLDLRKSSNTRP